MNYLTTSDYEFTSVFNFCAKTDILLVPRKFKNQPKGLFSLQIWKSCSIEHIIMSPTACIAFNATVPFYIIAPNKSLLFDVTNTVFVCLFLFLYLVEEFIFISGQGVGESIKHIAVYSIAGKRIKIIFRRKKRKRRIRHSDGNDELKATRTIFLSFPEKE